MNQIYLSAEIQKSLVDLAEKNFRTPELQIAYWLSKEGIVTKEVLQPKVKINVVRKEVKKSRAWTPEQRELQRERMKRQWAVGKIRPKKSTSGLDAAASASFDD